LAERKAVADLCVKVVSAKIFPLCSGLCIHFQARRLWEIEEKSQQQLFRSFSKTIALFSDNSSTPQLLLLLCCVVVAQQGTDHVVFLTLHLFYPRLYVRTTRV
jgi:hypothetical protein